jgi:hypothetical protein
LYRVRLGRATLSKVRDCLEGRRHNLPFRFAGVYGTDRKERIGVFAELGRVKKDEFGLHMRWFQVRSGPPEQYGSFSDLVSCLGSSVAGKEALVTASFSYDGEKVASVFSPIQIGPEAGIFDEIVGFSGIKRGAGGKLLYRLEVNLGVPKRLEHKVIFFQAIRLSDELPLELLDIADRISNLGLRKT